MLVTLLYTVGYTRQKEINSGKIRIQSTRFSLNSMSVEEGPGETVWHAFILIRVQNF